MKFKDFKLFSSFLAIFALVFLFSCSKQKFDDITNKDTPNQGGVLLIKPKVDILMLEDNSQSMVGVINDIKTEFPAFVTNISTDWDYNFAALPILHSANGNTIITQIVSNMSDYGSLLRTPSNYTGFVDESTLSESGGSLEYGFKTVDTLMSTDKTGFLRPDALLAVVVFSTGNDTETKISSAGTDSVNIDALNAYKDRFVNFKKDASLVKFYSVVSTRLGNQPCRGGNAFSGPGYMKMSDITGGKVYDICTTGIKQTLDDIKQNLVTQVINYVYDFIVLADEPDLTTVKITRDGAIIPQSETDGWSYIGYKQNLYTVNNPIKALPRTGFAFQLNGSARYSGTSKMGIEYKKKQ